MQPTLATHLAIACLLGRCLDRRHRHAEPSAFEDRRHSLGDGFIDFSDLNALLGDFNTECEYGGGPAPTPN